MSTEGKIKSAILRGILLSYPSINFQFGFKYHNNRFNIERKWTVII